MNQHRWRTVELVELSLGRSVRHEHFSTRAARYDEVLRRTVWILEYAHTVRADVDRVLVLATLVVLASLGVVARVPELVEVTFVREVLKAGPCHVHDVQEEIAEIQRAPLNDRVRLGDALRRCKKPVLASRWVRDELHTRRAAIPKTLGLTGDSTEPLDERLTERSLHESPPVRLL